MMLYFFSARCLLDMDWGLTSCPWRAHGVDLSHLEHLHVLKTQTRMTRKVFRCFQRPHFKGWSLGGGHVKYELQSQDVCPFIYRLTSYYTTIIHLYSRHTMTHQLCFICGRRCCQTLNQGQMPRIPFSKAMLLRQTLLRLGVDALHNMFVVADLLYLNGSGLSVLFGCFVSFVKAGVENGRFLLTLKKQ